MFFELNYVHHAYDLTLRCADAGVLLERDLRARFPKLKTLTLARADARALSPWDLMTIAGCSLPSSLERLVLHPNDWGWPKELPTAFDAMTLIFDRLGPGAVVEVSELPETMNPGTYEQALCDLSRSPCRLVWRRPSRS